MRRPVVTVIGPRWSVHTQRWLQFMERAGIEVTLVSWARRDDLRGLLALPRILLQARRRVAESDVTVVHTLGTHGFLSLLLPRASRQVLVPWGSEVHGATTHRWRRRVAERVLARSDLVLTTSRHFAGLVGGLSPSRVALSAVSWGVSEMFLHQPDDQVRAALRRRWGVREHSVVIFAPRGDGEVYRLREIVGAFTAAAREREDIVLFAVASRDSGADAQLPDATRLKLIDRLSRQEMLELFWIADVVVSVPTSDQRSTAVLEALATGSHVVLSDLPAYREMVEDGARAVLLAEPVRPALTRILASSRSRDETISAYNQAWARANENGPICESKVLAAVLGTEPPA